MKCVIDASFVASLFLPDEAGTQTALIASKFKPGDAAAPGLLQLEVTNILLMARRRGRVSGVDFQRVSDAFEKFPVAYQPALTAEQRASVVRLAEKHALTAYDAAYLELSIRLGLPMGSLDKHLIKAAKAEGVALSVVI